MKKALITGVTGQDGSYLAQYLLYLGYEVHGVMRRASSFNMRRLDCLRGDPQNERGQNFQLHYGDLTDAAQMLRLIHDIEPEEIYNLAAQSHVGVSFNMPEYTSSVTGMGILPILEGAHSVGAKVYQASSSEMFGDAYPPLNEDTIFSPQSPYAAAKVFAHSMCTIYKNTHDLFVCCGILFNHESPRRGLNFVTRKITSSVAEILAGTREKLYLGNLHAVRDWGYAPEYVEVMHQMLQKSTPVDYVIGTGASFDVEDILEFVFGRVGLRWCEYVERNSEWVLRPWDVEYLQADCQSARLELGWDPKVDFGTLLDIMLEADLDRVGFDFTPESPWNSHDLPWLKEDFAV